MRLHLISRVVLLLVLLCGQPLRSHSRSDVGHLYTEGLVSGFQYAGEGAILGSLAGFVYAAETATFENNFNLGGGYPALGAALGVAVGSALGSGLGVHRAGEREGYRGSLVWTLVGSSLGAALPTLLWVKFSWHDWREWPPGFGNSDLTEGKRVSRRSMAIGTGAVGVTPLLSALGATVFRRLTREEKNAEAVHCPTWPIVQVSLNF